MRHLDQARRLVSNFGWATVGEVAGRVIGLVIAVYLARVLGASLYGAVGVILAVVGIFEIMVRAGTGLVGIREVALAPASIPAIHARITGLRLTLAALCILLLWVAAPAFAAWLSVPEALVRLYSLMLLASALTTAWALRGLERMDILAWGSIFRRLLMLVAILLLVTNRDAHLLRIPVIEVFTVLLAALWFRLHVSRQYGPLPVRFSPRDWRRMSPETLPMTLSALLALVYVHGDVLLLGWLSDTGNAGRFLASQKIVLTFMVLGVLLNRAALPATSRFMAEFPAQALALHAKLYRYLMLCVVPAIVATGFFAARLLEHTFGEAFTAAAPALVLLLCTLPVVNLAESLKHLLLTRGMAHRLMLGTALAAGTHVLLAIALIPGWHMTGAAIACLAGETAGLGLLLMITARTLGGVPLNRLSLAPFMAGAAMAVVLAAAHDWAALPRVAAGMAAYVAAAGLLRALSAAEWRSAARVVVSALQRRTPPAPK